MDTVDDDANWSDGDDLHVVLVDEPAPAPSKKPKRKLAKRPTQPAPFLASSAENELANKTPFPKLMTSDRIDKIDLNLDFLERRCWVGLVYRVGRGAWFEPRPGWLPFVSELRFKHLAFLVELHMGLWPGWQYHTVMQRIFETEGDRLEEAPWAFCSGRRYASPLAYAHTGELIGNDWIYAGDRIVIKMKHVYYPAWLRHVPAMFQVCSFIWRYIPNVEHEPSTGEKDLVRKRELLPLHRTHPHHAALMRYLYASFAQRMFPARPSTKPMFELESSFDYIVLAEVPGVKQRLWALAPMFSDLQCLTRDELAKRLWLGREPVALKRDESMDIFSGGLFDTSDVGRERILVEPISMMIPPKPWLVHKHKKTALKAVWPCERTGLTNFIDYLVDWLYRGRPASPSVDLLYYGLVASVSQLETLDLIILGCAKHTIPKDTDALGATRWAVREMEYKQVDAIGLISHENGMSAWVTKNDGSVSCPVDTERVLAHDNSVHRASAIRYYEFDELVRSRLSCMTTEDKIGVLAKLQWVSLDSSLRSVRDYVDAMMHCMGDSFGRDCSYVVLNGSWERLAELVVEDLLKTKHLPKGAYIILVKSDSYDFALGLNRCGVEDGKTSFYCVFEQLCAQGWAKARMALVRVYYP